MRVNCIPDFGFPRVGRYSSAILSCGDLYQLVKLSLCFMWFIAWRMRYVSHCAMGHCLEMPAVRVCEMSLFLSDPSWSLDHRLVFLKFFFFFNGWRITRAPSKTSFCLILFSIATVGRKGNTLMTVKSQTGDLVVTLLIFSLREKAMSDYDLVKKKYNRP